MKLKTLKILIAIFIIMGLFTGGFIFSMYHMHIGETIKVGAGYGFKIGMSKENAFQVLLEKGKRGDFSYIYCFAKALNTGELVINLENRLDILRMNDWQIRVNISNNSR